LNLFISLCFGLFEKEKHITKISRNKQVHKSVIEGNNTAEPWHSKKTDEVMLELGVTHEGLTSQEAQERLKKYGYNELVAKKRKSALSMFLGEFKDIFILLLIVATIFSAIIG